MQANKIGKWIWILHQLKLKKLKKNSVWTHKILIIIVPNPKHLVFRKVPPKELRNSCLWWEGPTWLPQSPLCWPHRSNINRDNSLLEMKPAVLTVQPAPEECWLHFCHSTSSKGWHAECFISYILRRSWYSQQISQFRNSDFLGHCFSE